MLSKIIEYVNDNTNYRLEFDTKDKILFIRTNNGVQMEDFINIKRAVRPFVNDIRVTSRWN